MPTTRTERYSFRILRTPVDIVFKALFDYGYNRERSLQTYMFYEYGHISGFTASQDTTFVAVDMKFYDQNEGLPPKAQQKPKTKQTTT